MIIEPETDRTLKLHPPPKRDILLPQEKELDEESLVDSRNSIPDQSFRFFVKSQKRIFELARTKKEKKKKSSISIFVFVAKIE